MRKIRLVIFILLVFCLIVSCASSSSNNIYETQAHTQAQADAFDPRQVQASLYEKLKTEFNKFDAAESNRILASYLAGGSTTIEYRQYPQIVPNYIQPKATARARQNQITIRLREERGFNWGYFVVLSPIRAKANLHINGYRYRRSISDPREILFLIISMQAFGQSETRSGNVIMEHLWIK